MKRQLKGKPRKLISLIVAISMVFTSISISANEKETKSGKRKEIVENSATVDEEGKQIPVAIKELRKERELDSNTYLLNNGMKKTVYYTSNVRFEENGDIKEYEPKLVKTDNRDEKEIVKSKIIKEENVEKYSYVNKAGDSKQYMPKKIDKETPVLLTQDKYKVSFVPTKEIKKANEDIQSNEELSVVKTNKVNIEEEKVENIITGESEEEKVKAIYDDEEGDMSLSYQSMEHGVKEEIILYKQPETNILQYEVNVENMSARLDSVGGGISFIDEEKDMVLGGIPAPNMNDATGKAYSEEAHYELEQIESKKKSVNKYILKIVIDENYLMSGERQYPVTIDPTVTWVGSGTLSDVYVLKSSASTNYYSSGVKTFSIGKGSQGVFRSYIKIDSLANKIKNKYVESAKLLLCEYPGNVKGTKINISPAAKKFLCGSVTWNNQPGGTGSVFASFTASGTTDAKKMVNVTSWARNIAKGSGDGNKNYGLYLKASDESVSSYVKLYGARCASTAKQPKLEVEYYDGPTTASKVSVSKEYVRDKEKLQVSWEGIKSKALSHIQYRILKFDKSTNSNTDTVLSYSETKSIGTTSSGNKTIDVSQLDEGDYKIYVRGVDKAGIVGTGSGVRFTIDRTVPVVSDSRINTSWSYETYSNVLPMLAWNIKEKNLSGLQVSLNFGTYKTIATVNKGSMVLTGLESGRGNVIDIRAVDKAGNISECGRLYFAYDNEKPIINEFKITPDTSEEKYSNEKIPTIKYNVFDKSLKEVSCKIGNSSWIALSTQDEMGDIIDTFKPDGKLIQDGQNDITLKVVDMANNTTTKTIKYYRDMKNPETGKIAVTPKTNFFDSRSALPTIKWEGFTDDALKEIQVSIDDGAYKTLGLEDNGTAILEAADFPKSGKYDIKVRAIDKAGNTSDEVSKTYYYKDTVSEVDKYTPINVYATEKIGGGTIIKFDNKEQKYPSDIEYEIHRGITPMFVPSDDTLVKAGVKHTGSMVAGEKGVTYYYKVRAVTADGEKQYSDFSEEISSTTLTDDEIKNRCGNKEIYDYLNITTPVGTGNIELSKGNFVYEQSDMMLPAPQIPIEISRVYNSASNTVTDFGYGWSSAYDAYISETKNKIYYQDGTKAVYEFTKNGEEYICEDDSSLKLQIKKENIERIIKETVKDSDGKEEIKEYPIDFDSSYVITNKENDNYYFNDCGKLVCIEESNGTFLYIECDDKTGSVKTITTSSNQKIQFSYEEKNANGRKFISKISINDGSYYEYKYENDRMTKATHVGNKGGRIDYNYSYDEEGRLNVVTDAMGNDYSIIYGAKGAEKAIYPNGEYYKINISDDKTIVSKHIQNDNKLYSETYKFDKDGKKTEHIDAMENVSTYSYKGELLTSSVDKTSYYKIVNGVVTLVKSEKKDNTEYDSNGNVLKQTDRDGNVTTYTYDNKKENLKNFPTTMKVTDAQGNVNSEESYEYDDLGNVIKTIDYTTNTVSTYVYDENGNVTKSQETLVKESEIDDEDAEENGLLDSDDVMEYDDDGNTETEDSASGTVKEKVEANYDSVGNIEDEKDNKGIITEYKYDEFGRTIETKETSKEKTKTTKSEYDENGEVTKEIDAVGRVTAYEYDNMGRVVRTTLTVGNDTKVTSTLYGYDSIDIHVGTKSVKKLENTAVITILNTDEEIIGQTYTNSLGQTVKELSNGLYVDYTYDNQGKVLSTYTGGSNENNINNIAEGKLTVNTYDDKGNVTDTIINPEYNNGSYIVTEDSIVTSNVYDSTGMLTKNIDAKGNTTNYQYDEQGRLINVKLCNGNGNNYQYDIENTDKNGALVSTSEITTDALGRVSETVSNGAGQIMSVTDKSSNGNLTTSYEYDKSGNKSKEIYSDGSYITYEYDEYNNILKSITYKRDNTADKVTEYEYDEEYKLTKKIDSKGGEITPYRYTIYTYDAYGRQIGISEINSSNEPSQPQVDESMIKYTYDLDDNITRIEYPNNLKDELKGISFKYNKDKWITEIDGILKGNTSTKIRAYEYYSDGKIKNMQDFYGFLKGESGYIQRDYAYDVYDRVVSMKYWNSKHPDKILEQYEYAYDKNSNILSAHTKLMYENQDVNQGNGFNRDELRTYKYDELDRLIETNITNNLTYTVKNICYEYDKVGNRVREIEKESNIATDVNTDSSIMPTEEQTTSTVYTYNDLDQLVRTTETSSNKSYVTKYEYDKKGNQIKVTDAKNNTITENVYDVESQLTGVAITKDGKVTTVQENEYNGDGQRESKTENGIRTNYFYEGDALLYTTDENGNKTSQNIIGLEGNTISSIRYDDGQRAYFYSKDIQGSTSVITDDVGNYVESYEYTDFGETKKYGNTDFYNEICYTGGVYDEATGLYYLNARYYNPEEGVFLSQDTYRGDDTDFTSWNLYGYCAGNPIKYVDPSGHWIDIIADAIGFAVDAYAFIKDPSVENGIFLAVDVAMVLLPCVTGASIVRTSIKKGNKVVASSKYGTKAKTVRNNVKQAGKKVIAKYGGKKIAKQAVKKKVKLTFKKLRGKVKEVNKKIFKKVYGTSFKLSEQKMYQAGKHYNKHGRSMGYASKKEYEKGARDFWKKNKKKAEIYEGTWTSARGKTGQREQIIVRRKGKQLIIDKNTKQIIDFYEGTSLNGFKDIRKLK